ncbi:MAG TPA: hypothetical protein VE010_23640 [Thermoanaerobaculia bacterium]|nr:hypothetical protein [Thermoanaerobaculia bacterium]
MSRFLIPILLLVATAVQAADQKKAARVNVPRAQVVPTIDGKLSPKEWASARQVALADGAHARLQHDGRFLYIALVGKRVGIGSICTPNGNQVRVLHASAGLGTAVYDKKDGKWSLTRGFTFTNRDTSNSQTGIKDRKAFLSAEGWFANTDPAGTLEREYQLPIGGRREIPLVLSFMSFLGPYDFDLDAWPETVTDACVELELTGGFTEREYTFAPETWGIAVID